MKYIQFNVDVRYLNEVMGSHGHFSDNFELNEIIPHY